MSSCSTHRWPIAPAMSLSASSASSLPWRMPRRRPSSPWRKFTTAICCAIRCSPPARCPASTSRRLRSSRAAPGRCRCPIITASTPRTGQNTRVLPPRPKVLPTTCNGTCMSGVPPEKTFRDEELLADVICRLIGDVRHVAVRAASPIPAIAALLARERADLNNHLGEHYVSLLGSRAHTFFTDGVRELFDCGGQGRIDVFFLSGGQIDGEGNINLVSVGDYDKPKARFPGSFASAFFFYGGPKGYLF